MRHLEWCRNRSGSWFFLSGLGLGIGFFWPALWWLVFPAAAAFFYGVEKSPSTLRAALGGFVAFSIKMGFSFGWVWTTYPIEWVDLGLGKYELFVIGFYWLTLALAVGVSGAFLASALRYWIRFGRLTRLVSAGFFWLGAELLGALLFSLFTYGTGGTIHALFGFGMAGNHLAQHAWLLQFARLGGVFILTYIAILVGVILYEFRYVCFKKYAAFSIGFSVLALLLTSTVPPPGTAKPLPDTVAIVDTTFGGSDFFSLPNQEEVEREAVASAVRAAIVAGAQYVVLPEGSATIPGGVSTYQAYQEFQNEFSATDVVVIESVRTPISLSEAALRARVYDGVIGEAYSVDKQRLVTQGEFMPNFYLYAMKILGFDEAVSTIEKKINYRPGPYYSQSTLPGHVPSILFCYAESDPLSVWHLVRERNVPFIVHPISHAWFHSSESLWHQYDAMRKIQAVWNQVSIVSSGNMAKGAWYTTRGEKVYGRRVADGEYWNVMLVP